MAELVPIEFMVNGRRRSVEVPASTTLLDLLREDLGLTGTKECCDVGECGACTIVLDGRAVDSCMILAVEADGTQILTIEGLGQEGKLSELQEQFLEKGAVQCGFCTPGQLIAAHTLLQDNPHPSLAEVQEGMAGNLCRCGCYYQITEAILAVAEGAPR